jgi:hypothetical protein
MNTADDDYQRGHAAGGIEERLAGHDRHFAAINGSLEKFVDQQARFVAEMHALTLAVQRLGDQAVSRDATAVTTAAALKAADEERRDRDDRSWSPVARVLAVIGGLAAVAAIVGVWLAQRG